MSLPRAPFRFGLALALLALAVSSRASSAQTDVLPILTPEILCWWRCSGVEGDCRADVRNSAEYCAGVYDGCMIRCRGRE